MVDEQQSLIAERVLGGIPQLTGIMWEKIEEFQKKLSTFEGGISHNAGDEQCEELQKTFPLKQHIEGGLYTREIFMPKGSVVISMIHKQDHPSFVLKGVVSFLDDKGVVRTVKGPHKIFTKIGTQRVLYIHEDTTWCCVYKTKAKTFEEAEADVYTNNYKDLPKKVINKIKKLWQDSDLQLQD
jgi:hypothetical protein